MNSPKLFALCLLFVPLLAPAQANDAKHGAHGSQPQRGGVATSWKQIPVPPLRPFKPEEPRRVELPNGMVLFLQEDHELPLIDGVIRIRGGSRDEPAEKAGLAAIYGEVW